ncbi:MAG: cobalamin biosynthesis protein CobQ [Eubacteriales bacterium]|nr:cobalamin biosynthesis protein CobQ [Eubacteriales bacterium]MDD3881036.1 cobalamin biosynthesis protein CobQ [Eubacteriales bacterium]MDD4511895.1 cobalamin biosynthesis protein CobQ [Eubacteriales bacterium]
MADKRYIILTGNYGSGKTEIALNMAVKYAGSGKRVCLVDFDIVNPYFRSAERKDMLVGHGVRVLMPTFAMSAVDIPALPAEIQSVFNSDEDVIIFDVGGDDTGAAALGVFEPSFKRERDKVTMLFVVNACRPLSGTAEDTLDLMERVSERARMKPDAIVNNTNTARDTEAETVLEGQRVLREISEKTGLPIAMTVMTEDIAEKIGENTDGERFILTPYMRPEWLDI